MSASVTQMKDLQDVLEVINPPPVRPRGRPKKSTQFEVGHKRGGRPVGLKNKEVKVIASALIGEKVEEVTKMLLKIGLNEKHKDQMTAIKLLMERILPPVREVNVRQDTQTAINIVVEGVQKFVKESVIEGEVLEMLEE